MDLYIFLQLSVEINMNEANKISLGNCETKTVNARIEKLLQNG